MQISPQCFELGLTNNKSLQTTEPLFPQHTDTLKVMTETGEQTYKCATLGISVDTGEFCREISQSQGDLIESEELD